MVGSNGIDDQPRHLEPLAEFSAEHGMGAFLVVVHCFADIVEQGTHLGNVDVGVEFGG